MSDIFQLSPVMIVACVGLLILVMDLFRGPEVRGGAHLAWITTVGLAVALGVIWKLWPGSAAGLTHPLFAGGLLIDAYTLFFWASLLVMTAVSVLSSAGFDSENNLDHGEYYSFYTFALVGMMLMVAAGDLLLLFLALETMSLAVYVLVAMKRDSARAAEGALKCFLTGAAASAILLYGIALLWGETGTLNLVALGNALANAEGNALIYAASALVLIGFAFKVAVVPFHMWAPDAYQGAPTPVSGYMASAVRAATFAALLRVVFTTAMPDIFQLGPFNFVDVVVGLSIATMVIGNLLALHQDDVKRMLAYSSISQAGFLAMGLVLIPQLGSGSAALGAVNGSILFYLVACGFATLLGFGVVARLGKDGSEDTSLSRLKGLAERRPGLAFLLALSLLSLAGFPPTVGFFGKFYLFRELMVIGKGRLIVLVAIAVVNALFAVYYYLRPIVAMYMQEAEEEQEEIANATSTFALVLLAIAVLILGLFPSKLADLTAKAGKTVPYSSAAGLTDGQPADLAPFAKKEGKK